MLRSYPKLQIWQGADRDPAVGSPLSACHVGPSSVELLPFQPSVNPKRSPLTDTQIARATEKAAKNVGLDWDNLSTADRGNLKDMRRAAMSALAPLLGDKRT
jgi:hypothetical protein